MLNLRVLWLLAGSGLAASAGLSQVVTLDWNTVPVFGETITAGAGTESLTLVAPGWGSNGAIDMTRNQSYVRGFNADPSNGPGADIIVRVNELYTGNAAPGVDRQDKVGDQSPAGGTGTAEGPYTRLGGANHDFGTGSPVTTLKVVTRDYNVNGAVAGPVEFVFDFSAYPQGVRNVRIQMYDVDWRGTYALENTVNNDEQDMVSEVRGTLVGGGFVPLTLETQPWNDGVNPPANSYLADQVNTLAMRIIGRAGTAASPGTLAATDNPTVPTTGFVSSDTQGYGNLALQTNATDAVSAVRFLWSPATNNPRLGNEGNGYGFEIGLITFEPIPEPAGFGVLAGLVAIVAARLPRRRRVAR